MSAPAATSTTAASRERDCEPLMDDEKKGGDPKKYACEYPSYPLDKVVSGKFATSGSPAVKVVKRFKWTSADQNFVANLIAGKKMSKDKAAAVWVKRHAKQVNAWVK